MIIALGSWYIGSDLVECTPNACAQRVTPLIKPVPVKL